MNIDHLYQIFSHYTEKFEELNNSKHKEYYKWRIINRFRDEMDAALAASDDDFPGKLREVKKLTANLIDSYTQPFSGLIEFANEEPETVRQMFLSLYQDDGGDIKKRNDRIYDFLVKSHELRDKHSPGSYMFNDDMHSVTGYLFLYDPDHNYLFKASHALKFADCVEFYDDWGTGDTVKLDVYYRMCDQLVEEIKACKELMATDASRFDGRWGVDPDTLYPDPEKHILAFDLIYCCSSYNLFKGITFVRPKTKERQLFNECKGKALELSKKMEDARSSLEELEKAKEHVNSIFSEGTKVYLNKFGEGVIVKNTGTSITVNFPESGEKQFGTFIALENGLITADGVNEDELQRYVELIKQESILKSSLQYAEKEFAAYSEFLE